MTEKEQRATQRVVGMLIQRRESKRVFFPNEMEELRCVRYGLGTFIMTEMDTCVCLSLWLSVGTEACVCLTCASDSMHGSVCVSHTYIHSRARLSFALLFCR